MKKYQLIVAGGGLTGVAAAISAAREGVKDILIIEKFNCFGGAAATCLVHPFMPFWTVNPETKQKDFLSKGIFAEIRENLKAMGSTDSMDLKSFNDEILKLLLNRMVTKEGIDILFNTTLCSVNNVNGHIKSVNIVNEGGQTEVEADYFIDATGDADLAYFAGCPTHLGREDNLCQPMTLCFRVINVDMEKFAKSKPSMNSIYNLMQAEGKIKNPRENVLTFLTEAPGVVHFNSTRIVKRNPCDGFDLTKADIEAREQVFELFQFMKEHIDGFQNSYLMYTAMQTGVRESRMIIGKHVFTVDELFNCTVFPDSIAVCNYNVDIHNPEGSGTSQRYLPEGKYYTIPYRSLLPLGADNLLVGGRCISSDHEAQASYRIMPTCCTLGEACGTAVSVAVKSGKTVENIDIKTLQDTLVKNGARIY